jgi:hypothetical protein
MGIVGCSDAKTVAANRQHTETHEGGRPTAQVIHLRDVRAPADPPRPVDQATAMRQASRDLAATAAQLTACSDKMAASMAILARGNAALRTQASRARAIVRDAERIADAIDAGDLNGMIALRAELFGGV